MLLCHLAAIGLTLLCVVSGADWNYFQATRSAQLQSWMFPAVPVGGLLPIILPLVLLVFGSFPGGARIRLIGWAVAQAQIIGGIVAACYKAVTGRAHPSHEMSADLTHLFRFGFLRGGVFWGWPSSHTTIAFAMAAALYALFPKLKWVRIAAIGYAFYIGLGVSMTIHWLSDFIAGALIGTAVGVVVGKSFGPCPDNPPTSALA